MWYRDRKNRDMIKKLPVEGKQQQMANDTNKGRDEERYGGDRGC